MQHLIPVRPLLLLCKQALTATKAGLIAGLLLLVAAAANPAFATGFYKDFVVVNGSYYYTNLNVNDSNIRNFQNADLGEYNLGYSQLRLGGEANTYSDNGDAVQPPQMYYRIYPQGAPANSRGGFAALNLRFARSGDDGNASNQTWNNITDNPDLLGSVGTAGTYVLEIYYFGTATYNNSGGSGSFVFYDSNNSNNYTATFKVVGTRPLAATWVGGSTTGDNNWFNDANWSSGKVPTSNTDVTIPYPTSGNGNAPRINSGVATTRNLTILSDPNQSPVGKSLFQFGGELQVYGDFTDDRNNFQQNTGILTLASTAASQTFQGGPYATVHITGGGIKFLRGLMNVANVLAFVGSGGVLSTGVTNVSQQGVVLSSDAAIISGETEDSYVLGALSASRTVMNNIPEYFGYSGIDLRVTSGNPGIVLMTRVTGYYFSGVGTSQSILRGYNFTPGQNNPASNVNNLTFDLTFHYRDAELNNIKESDLRLFRSVTSTVPFEGLAFTSMSASANTLTRTGITGTLAATFTLGDINNPLPVELVSFTATGTAQGAALKWLTASEVNNKGFGIERQVAGATTWQSVGYVAANNQANGSSYGFLDKTIPASATQVYYRLRQEDNDGSLHYSPVATISRAAQGADLTLSPVPLQGGPLAVSFAEVGQAGTEILVLNMQGQRVARYTTAASTDGAVSLPLDNLAAGVYMVRVQVPGQATRHARFVKQ